MSADAELVSLRVGEGDPGLRALLTVPEFGRAAFEATGDHRVALVADVQIEVDPNVLGLDQPLVEQRDWMREYLPTQLSILGSRELASMAREQLTDPSRANPIGAGGSDRSQTH